MHKVLSTKKVQEQSTEYRVSLLFIDHTPAIRTMGKGVKQQNQVVDRADISGGGDHMGRGSRTDRLTLAQHLGRKGNKRQPLTQNENPDDQIERSSDGDLSDSLPTPDWGRSDVCI